MKKNWCSVVEDGVRIALQIQTNAKRTEVIGPVDDALKIRIHAQAINGKANDALVAFLSEKMSLPKGSIVITHGHTAKRKLVLLRDKTLTEAVVKHRLACP